MTTPNKLDWKEFEELVKDRGQYEDKSGNAVWRKNGRLARMAGAPGSGQVTSVPSFVDFSGTVPLELPVYEQGVHVGDYAVGQAIHFDCKVCSQASMSLQPDHFSRKQKRQLTRHAVHNATCFLLIHFNERELRTKHDIAETIAMPVHPEHPFWLDVADNLTTSLNREVAREYGVAVSWDVPGKTRTLRPDVLSAVKQLHEKQQLGFPERKQRAAKPAPF